MNAKEAIATVKQLPPVSPAGTRLIHLLNHDAADNDEIVFGLKTDMALTAKLLGLCNSSRFAFDEPISSVDQALLMLGHQNTLRLVLALSFGDAMGMPLPGYAVAANELWRHSLIAASAAEIVVTSGLNLPVNPQLAFTTGLLHDIGKLVLGQVITARSQAEIRQTIHQHRLSCAEAERQILGTDHAEVGACLLEKWHLPEDIIEGVAHHHQPQLNSDAGLSVVAHLADCLAHLSGAAPGWDSYAVRVSDLVTDKINITTSSLERMIIAVRESCARLGLVAENAA